MRFEVNPGRVVGLLDPKYEDAKFKYAGGQMTIDLKLRY